jgi:hypothetical protein
MGALGSQGAFVSSDDLDRSVYDLIQTHGLPEVLRSIAWHEEARASRPVVAASSSAPTLPAPKETP